jgi:circadian clock protein KaiC
MTEVDTGSANPGIERVPSGVPGLDAVLCGGLLSGGVYLVQGSAGTGKTILSNQIMFTHMAAGGSAVFITVLGENHTRMMAHLRLMRFFDMSRIPAQVTYVSAYQSLEDEQAAGVLGLIRQEVMARGAKLLVLDGASAIETQTPSEFELKKFVHELQTLASSLDCTMLLLTTSGPSGAPEQTMVDGLIELKVVQQGVRSERRVLVRKFRGSEFLEGEHAFCITTDGVTIFPRIEAQYAVPTARTPPPPSRISIGVEALDRMFGGGLPRGSVGALVGPSGSGKTTLGLHFLSASSAAEPGLMFGCYEPPERLRLKASLMGFDLAAAERRGDVEILWHPIGEHILDELAARLLDAVRERKVKRLVIDGLSLLQHAAIETDRIVRFWSALTNELRARGVTTFHTSEMPAIIGADFRMPMGGVASLAEVMVVLRYVELRSRLYRLISLVKVREGAFDPAIRNFIIGDSGIVVGGPFEGVEAVLSGIARRAAGDVLHPLADDDERPSAGGV